MYETVISMPRAIEKAFRMLPYKAVKLEEWAIRLTMLVEALMTLDLIHI